jgi:hypothetical protein
MTNEEKELIDNVYKKFQTTMIGSLARFESIFGHLWEDDSVESDRFADMWEYARNSILNNGNKQARAAIEDINNFLGGKNKINQKYNYKFYFNKNKGDNNYED